MWLVLFHKNVFTVLMTAESIRNEIELKRYMLHSLNHKVQLKRFTLFQESVCVDKYDDVMNARSINKSVIFACFLWCL